MKDIHPSAIVHPSCIIGENVSIGPFSVISANVEIGDNSCLVSSVTIDSHTIIGHSNILYPGVCIGCPSQDRRSRGVPKGITYLGNGNVLREGVTIHAPTNSNGITIVEDNNLLLSNTHIGHDAHVGNTTTMINGSAVAGYVKVGSHAYLGGMAGVHQCVHLGEFCMIGGLSRITRDAPPYTLIEGNPAEVRALNMVGLYRAELDDSEIRALKKAFVLLYKSDISLTNALEMKEIKTMEKQNNLVSKLVQSIRLSIEKQGARGIISYGKK
uniref:Acyl-UDP-N-acetylglucosamine o-acyltransferase n=1 Tax=Gronococcus sybilensis TaxID=3028029 RepID=A0A9Y1I2J6_9RHOD|nr:acyl-UDP-N-acetylglucosamine o-acyltransferase [Gronococcus sybilensis]